MFSTSVTEESKKSQSNMIITAYFEIQNLLFDFHIQTPDCEFKNDFGNFMKSQHLASVGRPSLHNRIPYNFLYEKIDNSPSTQAISFRGKLLNLILFRPCTKIVFYTINSISTYYFFFSNLNPKMFSASPLSSWCFTTSLNIFKQFNGL